jgi:hypothetical protein
MSDAYELENEISLDTLLDDIPDLPGYVQLPTGGYLVTLEKGIEEKEINDRNYFSVECTVRAVIDLDTKALEEGEQTPKEGDVQSFLFARNHSVAMNNFKLFAGPIAKKMEVKSIREILEVSKGLDILLVGVRKSKKKDGEIVHNFQIKKVSMDF